MSEYATVIDRGGDRYRILGLRVEGAGPAASVIRAVCAEVGREPGYTPDADLEAARRAAALVQGTYEAPTPPPRPRGRVVY